MKPLFPLCSCLLAPIFAFAAPPADDPAAEAGLAWTKNLRWSEMIDISSVEGANADARLAKAQALLVEKGGGAVLFWRERMCSRNRSA